MTMLYFLLLFSQIDTIRAGDILYISVPNLDVLSGVRVQVYNDGTVFLPLLSHVEVAGLTLQEVKDTLSSLLSFYVKKPLVYVNIEEKASNICYIYGEVNKPGMYRFKEGHRVSDAINLAGGIGQGGDIKNIEIKKKEGIIFNFPLHEAGEYLIEPRDVIYVPRLKDIIIMGEVVFPCVYSPSEEKVLLSEIISRPYPYTAKADKEKIRIITERENKIVKLSEASTFYVPHGSILIIPTKRNLIRETFNFVLTALPLINFILLIAWHYNIL